MSVAKHKDSFADTAMKVASSRTTWTLRALVLNELLKREGVNAEFVLTTDKNKLVELLDKLKGGNHV